jgi:hypothetical protein
MKKAITSLLIAFAVAGCASRGRFPGAKSADIIACREYASHFGAIYVNQQFNACMEEAGYERRD